ncbi:MAG: ATP-binding protein [Pseudomonadota bacterium]
MPATLPHLPRKLMSIVGAGYGLALALIMALTVVGLRELAATNAHLETIVAGSNVKTRLANQMRDILRDRAISMLSIVVSGDPFDKDQEMMRFYGFGSAYQQVRLELDRLITMPREREVLARIDRLTRSNQPVMVRTVDLAIEGFTFLAFEELQREGLPLQRQLVTELDDLIQIQRDMTRQAAEAARADYARTRWLMLSLGLAALVTAAMVALQVMRRTARLAAASEQERAKFLTLFETNTDGIVILDKNGFTDCNPATLEMFRMDSVVDFLKKRPEDLGVENQPCGTPAYMLADRHIREAVQKGHAFFHWTARRPDGSTFPAEIALHAMKLGGEPVIQAIMRDVSVQKESEAALEAARDAALAAAQMKSQFVANVSHEIRTPMNGIIGMTRLLLDSRLDTRQREFAQTIAQSAESLLGVINDLLDFSKIEAGRLTLEHIDFDLAALLGDVRELHAPRAQAKQLDLELDLAGDLPRWVRGDPLRIRQILLNLVDNAIKFTSAGRVCIAAAPRAGTQDGIRFSISDTGIGMDEAAQGRIFKAFAQADGSVSRKYGGTGLGLAICRQLAELMGGSLTLQSAPGQGSTFHLDMPLPACPAPAPDRQGDGPASPPRFPGVTVLVAEDNPVNQKLIRYMLENLDIRVLTADDGRAACELLEHTPVDLVLMDCQMPDWDGLTATRAIREREAGQGRARLPVVALTANAMVGYAEVCREAGMDDYLTKPIREEALGAALARMLPGRARGRPDEPAPAVLPQPASSGFDLDKLRRICRGDQAQVREMLSLFVTSSEGLLNDLARAVAGQDVGQAARQAHQLKGAAAYLGAEEVASLAAETEAQAKAGDWAACLAAQEDLEAAFIRVRLEIEALD